MGLGYSSRIPNLIVVKPYLSSDGPEKGTQRHRLLVRSLYIQQSKKTKSHIVRSFTRLFNLVYTPKL